MSRLLAGAAALLVLGCGGTPDPNQRYSLALRWSFADGRSCADAGIYRIQVRDTGTLVASVVLTRCEAGRIGASGAATQDIGQVPGGERSYDVLALTAGGGVLYRGTVTVDAAAQPAADVVLYYSGGAN